MTLRRYSSKRTKQTGAQARRERLRLYWNRLNPHIPDIIDAPKPALPVVDDHPHPIPPAKPRKSRRPRPTPEAVADPAALPSELQKKRLEIVDRIEDLESQLNSNRKQLEAVDVILSICDPTSPQPDFASTDASDVVNPAKHRDPKKNTKHFDIEDADFVVIGRDN